MLAGKFQPHKEGPLQMFHVAASKRSSPGRAFLQRRGKIKPEPIKVRVV